MGAALALFWNASDDRDGNGAALTLPTQSKGEIVNLMKSTVLSVACGRRFGLKLLGRATTATATAGPPALPQRAQRQPARGEGDEGESGEGLGGGGHGGQKQETALREKSERGLSQVRQILAAAAAVQSRRAVGLAHAAPRHGQPNHRRRKDA